MRILHCVGDFEVSLKYPLGFFCVFERFIAVGPKKMLGVISQRKPAGLF